MGSLRARIALAVALTAGFYLLAITIGAGLIAVPVAVWASGDTLNIWLSGFMILTGGSVLRALVPPRPDDSGYGLALAPADQPRLRNELAAVAAAAGEEPPEAVYISLEVNAAVTEVGGSLARPGRRVIILGLPLIAGLTREELRAVLAHEYGHYAGGDTRLGRWLWRARMVVVRTVGDLHRSGSLGRRIVAVPFEWYGKAFLRLTAAISRREELAADAYAARTAGRAPQMDALRRIAAYDALWERYDRNLGSVIERGLRPPLADGFLRMLHTDWAQREASAAIERQLEHERPDPYSSHPTLAERLAALERLADAPERVAERPEGGLSLLDDVDRIERDLLKLLLAEAAPRPRVEWEDVAERVELARAREQLESHRPALADLTVGLLPGTPARLDALARRSPRLAALDDADHRRAATSNVIAHALLGALAERGWKVSVAPGEEPHALRGDHAVFPFKLVYELSTGERDLSAWWDAAARMGIADIPIAPRTSSLDNTPLERVTQAG